MPQPLCLLQRVVIWVCTLSLWVFNSWGAPALAQNTADPALLALDQPLVKPSGLDSNNIPSEKVNQFVQACLQVITLIEQRESDLQGASTEAEATRIEQEIEAEALAIIEHHGLTRQEYLQLLGLANTDPEFGERVATQLQEVSV